jgi:5-methyltetrahydrofolate--homocysteine methyltransferase
MLIIGEKINATRKSIKQAILERDVGAIQVQIVAQDRAGAGYIDLNAGTGTGGASKEFEDLCWLIDLALQHTEKRLSLDSANPQVIRKAAEYLDDRRPWMINSVKQDEHILEELLPLAAQHQVPVIALAMNAEGIPERPEERIAVCAEICKAAESVNVPLSSLYFDPLIMPLSSNYRYGKIALDTLRGILTEFPEVNTTMGTSNVSFGLVKRAKINGAFLIAAIANGLNSAICDPTKPEIKQALLLGQLITSQDKHCRKFTRAVRKGVFE